MINRIRFWIGTVLGLQNKKLKSPQLMHFAPDIEHKTIEFMTIEEAIQSGIDVEKDEEKHGMKPIYYKNGKPEFVYDLIADPGFKVHIISEQNEKQI